MTRSCDEIQSAIKQLFSPFPQVVRVQKQIRKLASTPLAAEEPDIVWLVGESGVGKTSMLMRTAAEFPRIEHETFTEIPVLYVRMPSNCTYGNVTKRILSAFGTRLINGGGVDERMGQVKTLIANCEVRLLILDDANQMVHRGQSRSHYKLGDLVREVTDDTRVRLVVSGVPRLWRMTNLNEQLSGRVTHQIVVEPFAAAAEDKHSIQLALKAFDDCLGDLLRVQLTSPRACERFAFATAGRLRSIRKILVNAVEIAMDAQKPRLDYAVLQEAFKLSSYPRAALEGGFNRSTQHTD